MSYPDDCCEYTDDCPEPCANNTIKFGVPSAGAHLHPLPPPGTLFLDAEMHFHGDGPGRFDAFLEGIDTEHEAHQRKVRSSTLIGSSILLALQIADLLLTARFRSLGLAEGNGIMVPLLDSPAAAGIKLSLVAVFSVLAYRRPSLGKLCGVWAVVGFYVLACYVNWSAIQAVQALR